MVYPLSQDALPSASKGTPQRSKDKSERKHRESYCGGCSREKYLSTLPFDRDWSAPFRVPRHKKRSRFKKGEVRPTAAEPFVGMRKEIDNPVRERSESIGKGRNPRSDDSVQTLAGGERSQRGRIGCVRAFRKTRTPPEDLHRGVLNQAQGTARNPIVEGRKPSGFNRGRSFALLGET